MAVQRRAGKGQFDVVLGDVPAEAVGSLIVQSLAVKGFCVIDPGFEAGIPAKAVKEAEEQDFYRVNAAVADGLLGAEGSSQIADLESGLDDEARSEGEHLKNMDHMLTRMGYVMEPYIDRIGFDMTHRSSAVLHRAGEAEEETPPLNEIEVSKWQQQFLRHKLMVLIFFGPRTGSLELEPFETPDAEPFQVKTQPGMMVVLRPDTMLHRHSASGEAFAVSCFYMIDAIKKRAPEGGWRLVPAAKIIEDWTLSRLKNLKELEDIGQPTWDPDVPSGWRKAMNHMYHKGQESGVGGVGLHFCSTYEVDNWFKSTTVCPDYAQEVPIVRWDHGELYDPDPEGWQRGKSYCRHGNFMEGTDLFDNKFFNLSPNESRGLDPHQRLLMEQGYNCLASMGLKKKNLMNAAGGVYVGCGTDEWAFHTGRQGFGGVTGQLCMYSGRFSFCLGLKGPAITLTTEQASGLSATYIAAESVFKKGLAVSNDFAVAVGVHIMLAPMWWPQHTMNGWLSADGRVKSFNSSANGYIRGDGCACVGFKGATQVVDGRIVANEKDEFLGTVPGAMMNQNGRTANLSTPHGPGHQDCIVQAIRNAGISPLDIDAVEGHFSGKFLDEAIEVNTQWRAHRSDVNREPLCFMASKTFMGNQMETGGITGFLRILFSSQFMHMTPNLHLRQANPHSDPFDQPLMICSECLEYPYKSSYGGASAMGFGGTNVHVLGWATVNTEWSPPPASAMVREVVFWPGGGGQLEGDLGPRRRDGYTIAGSWTNWESAQKMTLEADGSYGFTVTMGENRWEQFQIWLDGDSTRVLHPGEPRMPQGSPVMGPEPDFEGGVEACRSSMAPTWLIDGRDSIVQYKRPAAGTKALTDGSSKKEEALATVEESLMVSTTEAGQPGDQYRVSLQINGKWRMVTWEKLASTSSDVPAGTYYVSGDWNDWGLEEMQADGSTPGAFKLDVTLASGGGDFQIVRDRDWNQVLYPNPNPDAPATDTVLGPDDLSYGFGWCLGGKPGDKFSIQLTRSVEEGKDVKKVAFQLTGHEATTWTERALAGK